MTAAQAPRRGARYQDTRQAIDLLCRRLNVDPSELADIIGKSRSTAYRRLAHPERLTYEELSEIADRFGVPVEVIVGGEMATMRWLVENSKSPTPDGGASVVTDESAPFGWAEWPEPVDSFDVYPVAS